VPEQTLRLFRAEKKSEAASKLCAAPGQQPLNMTKETVVLYNDCGYFLEQAALYTDAVEILNAVVAKFPNRTVAYLNRADAYWGLKQKDEAFINFARYAALMKQAGKEAKIPKRVTDRLKEK
jgi:tetratricopeptide (TPR) repeat protein